MIKKFITSSLLWVWIFLLVVATIFNKAYGMSMECEYETIRATTVHMKYVDGHVSLTESYNATAKMERICNEEKETKTKRLSQTSDTKRRS